jgi:hypothetical protein
MFVYGFLANTLICKLHGEAMTMKEKSIDECKTKEREVIGIYDRETKNKAK